MHRASENRARRVRCTEAEILKWMNEWKKNTFWASNFALKPKKFFRRPDNASPRRRGATLMGVVEFNHNPAKFYRTKMLKRRDKTMAPQIILGFVYPVDKVGQYLIYVKYCSTEMTSERSFTTIPPGGRILYYRKVSNIRRTKSQNLNNSCLVLHLSLPNPLKLGFKSILKM